MLNLVLTYHWYDETERGVKLIEYRAMSPKWKRDIWDKRHDIKQVRFQRAYTKTHLVRDVHHIDIGPCPIDGWNDDYYRIHLTLPSPPQIMQ